MEKVRLLALAATLAAGMLPGIVEGATVVPNEIKMPGTQDKQVLPLIHSHKDIGGPYRDNTLNEACYNCHEYSRPESIVKRWSGSLMAQASVDPIFWATMAIAEQDFNGSGDLCLRCHTPRGWYDGRSVPTDGSRLTANDNDGVSCELCHKMTNPDNSTLKGVMFPPFTANTYGDPGSDPNNVVGYYGSGMLSLWGSMDRLGPYFNSRADHPVKGDKFQRSVDYCGSCHDVSNPAVGDLAHNNGAQQPLPAGTYTGVLGSPVDGKAAFNNLPFKYGVVERTFSEYKAGALSGMLVSAYGTLPAELKAGSIKMAYDASQLAGKGGNYADGAPRYFSCQTCHVPPIVGYASDDLSKQKKDFPNHDMTGSGYWMPSAIKYLYNKGKLRLTLRGSLESYQLQALDEGMARSKVQLANAASLAVSGNVLKVTNLTGHKVISGYPEGRRMWLNIKWYDGTGKLLREDGKYGPLAVTINGQLKTVNSILNLEDPNTKIYEAHYAMTQEWAKQLTALGYDPKLPLSYDRVTGNVSYTLGQLAAQAPGTYHKTFHFVLNNKVVSDNRIPPYGMKYDDAKLRNCLPVPASQYGNPGAGGLYRHWDEVTLTPPAGAKTATIDLLYQPTSWEYIQFLYRANKGVGFLANDGANMLDAWLNTGMAAPFKMAGTTWKSL